MSGVLRCSCIECLSGNFLQKIAERIQHVYFFSDLHISEEWGTRCTYTGDIEALTAYVADYYLNHQSNSDYEQTIGLFVGSRIKRKTLRVRFSCASFSNHIEISQTTLFKSLATMTGFEAIVLMLECEPASFEPDEDGLEIAFNDWLRPEHNTYPLTDNSERATHFRYWEKTREYLRQLLEPYLGPGHEYDDERNHRCVKFHPFKHLSASVSAILSSGVRGLSISQAV